MINIKMLEDEMKRADVTNYEMANALGIDESTWHRKKKQPNTFTIGDIDKIKEKLLLANEKAILIFLS